MPPGPSGCPGSVSSSPVTSSATRGRRAQRSVARPTEAATPISAGPSRSPARSTTSPAAMSSPERRMLPPASVAGTLTRPFTCSVRSTGTTAVAPSGTSAPVEIAIASPWRTVAPAGCPARDSATTSSSAGSPAITAYPSMAELSNGGTEIWLATVLGQHAAERLGQSHFFGRQRLHGLEHQPARLGYGDQIPHFQGSCQ